jgi:excisionase family DNA binding protein
MSTPNGTAPPGTALYTVGEVAKRLALFTREVLEKVEAGELEAVRLPGNPRLFIRLPIEQKPPPQPPAPPPAPAPKAERPRLAAAPEPPGDGLPDDLITPNQVARLLKVHISTVYRWCLSGRLPSYRRAGWRFLIRRSDVRTILEPVRPSPSCPAEPVLGGERLNEFLRSRGYKV